MVMREIVHITLTMAALHELEVKAVEILNAYAMAPNGENIRTEKIWTVLDPELLHDVGKFAIILRA